MSADNGETTVTDGRRRALRAGGWKVQAHRPHPNVTLFDVSLSDYREFFFVVEGERSLCITQYDPSDESHLEPQVFVFAKPYEWDSSSLDDDEALLQIWQAVGVQR